EVVRPKGLPAGEEMRLVPGRGERFGRVARDLAAATHPAETHHRDLERMRGAKRVLRTALELGRDLGIVPEQRLVRALHVLQAKLLERARRLREWSSPRPLRFCPSDHDHRAARISSYRPEGGVWCALQL